MSFSTELREQNAPLTDANRPYGAAQQQEQSIRALKGAGMTEAPLERHPAAATTGVQPTPLDQIVNPNAAIEYNADGTPGTFVGPTNTPGFDPRGEEFSPAYVARPNLDRPGIESGQGGLARPEDATFQFSDELVKEALAPFPKVIKDLFANRKIDRPADVGELYEPGKKATSGGYYQGANGAIVLARGNADAYGDPNVDIGGAQHEILHAVQNELEPFKDDSEQGYPTMKAALSQDWTAMNATPATKAMMVHINDLIKNDDWGHVFTEIGLAYVRNIPLPPTIRSYFSLMRNAAVAGANPTDPNAYTPPNNRQMGEVGALGQSLTPLRGEQMEGIARRNAVAGYRGPTQVGRPAPNTLPENTGGGKVSPSPMGDTGAPTVNPRTPWGGSSAPSGMDALQQSLNPMNVARRAWEAVKSIPDLALQWENAREDPSAGAATRLGTLKDFALGVASPAGAVFSPITDTARRAVVESDPEMQRMFRAQVDALPEGKRDDSLALADAANATFDRTKDALANVADDPTASPGDRAVAGIVAGLMQTQQLAEMGAPSAAVRLPEALAFLRNSAPKVAERAGLIAKVEGATQNVPLDAEQLSARTGGVTEAQKAANGALAEEVAKKEAAAAPISPLGQKIIDALSAPKQEEFQSLGDIASKSIEDSRRAAVSRALRWATVVDPTNVAQVRKFAADGRTVLGHIDDMIDTIQNEVARGMTPPKGFLDELLDQRANISKTLADADAERAARLEAYKNANKEVLTAGADLGRATRESEGLARDARASEQAALKADIKGRSATEAQGAKAEARTAAAQGKVTEKTASVEAANLTDQQRLAQVKADAEARITALREKANDTSATAVDREKAKMDVLQESVTQQRQALAEAKSSSSDRVSFRGDAEPQVGYLNPDDKAVFDATNIHLGKQESPLLGNVIAQVVKDAQAAGEDISKTHVSWKQVAEDVTRKYGEQDAEALIEKVQKGLRDSPKAGETATLYQAGDKAITRLADQTRQAMARVASGAATKDEADAAAAKLLQFIEDFRDAVGESARATGSRRLINQTSSAELIQGTSTLRVAQARVRDIDKRLAKLDADTQAARVASDTRMAGITEANAKRDALVVQRESAIREAVAATEQSVRDRAAARADSLQGQIDRADALSKKLQADHDALSAKWEAKVQSALMDAQAAATARDLAQVKVSDAAAKLQEAIIKKRAAKMDLTPERMKIILALDPENVAGFVRAIRDQSLRKRGDILNTYVLTNMFGGAGQIANFVSNEVSLAANEMVYRPLSRVTANLPGYKVEVGGRASIVSGETEAAFAGLASSAMDAAQFVIRTIAQGEDVETAARRGLLEITSEGASALGASGRPAIAGVKGLPLEWPRRFLTAADGFNRIFGTSAEAAARTYRDAFIEAGGGKAGSTAGSKAVMEFKTNPDIRQLEAANEYSGRLTFNEPATKGSVTDLVVKLVNKEVGDTGLRPGTWLIPVVRFGINAAQASIRLSGGGLASGLMTARAGRQAAELGNDAEALMLGRKAAQEAAQGVVGAAFYMGASLLMDQGLATGMRPTTPKELAKWNAEKKEEMSVNILGHWVPYGLLGPTAAPFVMAALVRGATTDATKDQDMGDRAFMALAKFATDVPAVSGFYDLLDALNNGMRNGWNVAAEKYFARVATRFMPYSSTTNALTPIFDDTVKEPEDFIQRLEAHYPGLSGNVPAAIDPYTGNPERRYSSPLGLSPVGQQNTDPTTQGLIDQGHLLVRPSNTIANVKLTPAEFNAYESAAGKARHDALAAVQTQPDYQSQKDPKIRQAMLAQADSKAMNDARLDIARQMVDAAKSPADNVRAFTVLLAEGGTMGTKALALNDYKARLTPDVVTKIDEARMPNAQGEYPPAVADYLKAAPLVTQYLSLKPFVTGDETEWAKYVQARTVRTLLIEDLKEAANGKTPDPRVVTVAVQKKDPDAARLLAKYDDPRMQNSARKAITDANPWLDPFVSTFRYTQKRK